MQKRSFPLLAFGLAASVLFSSGPAMPESTLPTAEQEFQASVDRLALKALIRKGAWEELYARSVSGLEANPADPALLRAKIRSLRQLGYLPAARKALLQARDDHPEDPGLLLEQTWLNVTGGEWQQVLHDTEQAAAKQDTDSELLVLRGIALRETGKTDAAIAQFTRLLERKPTDCVSLTNRGRLLARAGDDARALVDLTAAISCPGRAEPLLARGALLLRMGRHAEAMEDLDKGLSISPDNLTGILARSEARIKTGDIDGARQDLAIARAVNPADPRVEPLFCRLAAAAGDWSGGIGCVEQSARQTPGDPAVWRALGKARLETGNLDGAVAAYDTLVKLAAGDQQARLERATVQILRRDYASASADCSAVIDQQPLATAYALRSLANYRSGNLIQADEDSTNALVLDRNEQTAILVKANLSLSRHDLQAAVADCERAFRRAPKSPWGATTCGRVHLQAGNLDKAAFYTERARALAPDDPETRELTTRLAGARQKTGVTPPVERATAAIESLPGKER